MKPERLNIEPDHLSRIESGEEPSNIEDGLLDARLFIVGMVDSDKKQLVVRSVEFQLIIGKLYKMGPDKILHRYVLLHEKERVLAEAHDGIAG